MEDNNIILIGYAGHSYVVYDILSTMKKKVTHYCDNEEKRNNPFNLTYLGTENEALEKIQQQNFFIAIGDNNIREKIFKALIIKNASPINAIHATAIISPSAQVNANGVMISAGAIINALSCIGKGTIINSGAIVEHDCIVGDFAHIAPGAVLCGNVSVGKNSFVGAGSVVKQGISIGENVIIGAGSVVVKNVENGKGVKGNPAK